MSSLISHWLAPDGFLIADYYINRAIYWTVLIAGVSLLSLIARGIWKIRRGQGAPKYLGPLLGIALFAFLWGCGEMGFRRFRKRVAAPVETMEGTFGKSFGYNDVNYGYRLKPNQKATARKKIDGKTIYDVVYTTDRYGRRTTRKGKTPSSKFAAFFGASALFGEGINDDETLPSQFAKQIPGLAAYNFGVAGYGPQHLVVNLENEEVRRSIPEKEGVVIYQFDESAIERAIGSLYVYGSWGPNLPYFHLDSHAELKHSGSFTTGRPWTSLLYLFVSRSEILKAISFNLPPIRESHFELVARMMVQGKQLVEKFFPGARFITVFYPNHRSQYVPRMKPLLEKAGVQYLDYSQLVPYDSTPENSYAIRGDGHPKPALNSLVARQLAQDVKGP